MKPIITTVLFVTAVCVVRGDKPPTPNYNAAGGVPTSFNPSAPQQQQPVVPQTNTQTSAPADKDFGFINPNSNQQGYYYYYYPVKDGVSGGASTGHQHGGSSWGSDLGTGFGDLGSSWTSLGVLGDVALGVSLIVVVVLAILLIYPNFAEVNARALSEVATPERMSRLATFVMEAIDKYSKKNKNN